MYNTVDYIKTDQDEDYTYRVVKQTIKNKDVGLYTTFGIQLDNCNLIINDVSCDEAEVIRIVNHLNQYQVSPIHCYDVIIDSLS